MRVTVTGATGLVGRRVLDRLRQRGDDITILSRSPDRARQSLGVEAVAWDPSAGPAPAEALSGRDAVVHLAGEPVAQRWNDEVKRRIHDSRVAGTRNLVAGLREAGPRPAVLVSASGVGYYGPHGDERLTESSPPGDDFLARLSLEWEREAEAASELGMRVAYVRTGVALDARGGALKQMLPPFRLGLGGPVAGGRQYMPWIHMDDAVGMALSAIDDAAWSGPVNVTAPAPVRNREFSKALGRALHRPAIAPVPKLALKVMFGEMGEVVATGQRVVPRRAQQLGYQFQHPEIDEALRAAIS